MNFRKVNNIAGWITGGIATLVYLLTMEATVSYWDCGEFLACAYKIEVGHSPGAPFFMLIQRMFGLLAGGDLKHVAILINSWSAIASGLTILFLFWTITHFAKKLLAPNEEELNSTQVALIIGSGLVGALAYTFSDTFWFSAVEAEVYATSSLFTALTFWAMLKWEHVADRPYADRWLLLIAYLIGLSIGIHLLNLLTIPALAMIYYFRRYKVTRMGTIVAFVLGCVALAIVQFGVIQGVTIMASSFDVFFVNSLGLPFDSGSLFCILLIAAACAGLIIYAKKKGYYLLHTGILCLVFVMIGFSSYIVPMIRSRADVPIDMTNPDNTLSLVSYVQREQFGSQPIVYGPDFDAQLVEVYNKGPRYTKSEKNGKDFYEVVGKKRGYKFDPDKQRFFPRIWDNNDPSHIQFYRAYLGLGPDDSPTSTDNLRYFFGYQMNWMWWRYFMWNYAGRQNDFEGQGEPKNGNWISGIKPIEKIRGLGDIDKMPQGYRDNGARNQLYFLPLILGIMGLVYQFNRRKREGFVVAMLFFFTGIAIGIYLNMPPLQPRERDYAFAGSTYAFAIWIGLGVMMAYEWMQRVMKGKQAVYLTTALCLLLVPALMAKEEWHDHDRSKKKLARATAFNTLSSCAKNAVLFTYGDNETYPLWYLQEVEGIRRDVRVINTSLLGIDWYIDQLNYRINDADAVPMIWSREQYLGDRREYIRYVDHKMFPQAPVIPEDRFFPIEDIIHFFTNDKNKLPIEEDPVNYLPTRKLLIPTPSKAELVSAIGPIGVDTSQLSTDMRITMSPSHGTYTKSDLAQMNIIAAVAKAGWKRPIYFSNLQETDEYGNLNDFMRLEGTVYRLMPYKELRKMPSAGPADQGYVDLSKSIDLFTKTYIWGNADRSDVYFDEKNRLNFIPYRLNASRIADELSILGRKQEAIAVLNATRKGISEKSYPYDFTGFYLAISYFHAGDLKQGNEIGKKVVDIARDDIRYAGSLPDAGRDAMSNDLQRDMSLISQMALESIRAGDKTMSNYVIDQLRSQQNNPAVGNLHIPQVIAELQQMQNNPQQAMAPPQQQ
ncbi:MAG: DUF2723 domain-containing protein [Bacteroidetes bacterium]|nr:DUF2723 domain-containing protein [Bacteroidota bacterium]MBS1629139.1 DUF2723 domain-containing protein [Bacteroidota bacterium]